MTETAPYVIDRNHSVWRLVWDGGMAVRATDAGPETIGRRALEDTLGPLVPFDPASYVASLPFTPTDCPGHKLVIHRDGRPAWCRDCGRMQDGRPHEAYVRTGRGGW